MNIKAKVYDVMLSLSLEKPENTIIKLSKIVNLKNKEVCEIGAGTGRILAAIDFTSIRKYYFVEPDDRLIKFAKTRAISNKISFIKTKGEKIDKFIKKRIDAAFFVDSFHHIKKYSQLKTLQTCFKILKKGGAIILVEFDSSKITGRLIKWLEKIFGEPGNFHSTMELKQLLEETGFRKIRIVNQNYVKMLPQFYIYGIK